MSFYNNNEYRALVDGDGLVPIQSVQKRWRDSFIGTVLDSQKWTVLGKGNGHEITVANGELSITTGVEVDTETILLSNEVFSNPFRVMFAFKISQKIVNQEFYLEAITVDKETRNPDGKGLIAWKVSGTDSLTSDYAIYQIQNQGTLLSSTSVDTNVVHVSSAYSIFELEPFSDEVWFHARAMDSTAGRSYSAVRHQQMPDPDSLYKLRIRVKNGSVAPASSTTMSMQFVNVVDYAELTAEITGGRGQSAVGQSMAVQVVNTIPAVTTVTTAYVAPKSVFYTDTTTNVTVATPYSSTARDVGTTNLYTTYRVRINSSHAGKLEILNGASATLASNKLSGSWNVEANVPLLVEVPIVARYIGFKFTNTGGATTTSFEALSALFGC